MSAVADFRIVRNSTVGAELTEEKAKLLTEKLGVRSLKDGELLVNEGEANQTLFILASGKLAVTSKDADGVEQPVYTMKEGECAGTRAFVEQSPRKATLRSVGDSTVYTLTPGDFESLIDSRPRLAFMVMRALFRVTHANLSRMNRESKELANYITKTQGRY
ncbi:MAG: cyclic nucleotide-binding domain-containing protein [Gammaproteobacteria bacterium]|nr:cyclic nucleotide-binding domain-containing protein [Gammaproteobacteria bacterium]MDD2929637.1 cyclic nucleotide-binding domain-containing protein [Sideroxydans sp.]